MASTDAAALSATERARAQPPHGPAQVLVASDDARIMTTLDRVCVDSAQSLDLRTGVLWIDVADSNEFLRSLVTALPAQSDRRQVRIAWTPLGATADQLLREALHGISLDAVAVGIQAEDAVTDPPTYEIRYQPLIRLDDRSVVGFESLIRAQQGGVPLNAAELIARADAGGWLSEFDQMARTLAIRGVGSWLGEGLLFLNVMAPNGEFDLRAISATIRQAEAAGIEADQIVLEAVESNRYGSIAEAADQVAALRQLGVRIALDDVGDGFAGLSLIPQFEPDVVKISGTIVSQLPSPVATAVIDAVVGLAHQTGAWVVAENIETEAQADALGASGVDWGQGIFFGAPASQSV